MRLQSTMAGLLAVFFLLLPCSSSMCALSCELSDLNAAGDPVATASAGGSIPSHCGHLAAGRLSQSEMKSNQTVVSPNQCHKKLCDRDHPAILTASGSRLDRTPLVIASINSFAGLQVSELQRLANNANATSSSRLPHAPPGRVFVLRL